MQQRTPYSKDSCAAKDPIELAQMQNMQQRTPYSKGSCAAKDSMQQRVTPAKDPSSRVSLQQSIPEAKDPEDCTC